MDGVYRFSTYSCSDTGENVCDANISRDQPYLNYWDEWTYVYFAYSNKLQKCFGYLKYTFRDSHFEIVPVVHLYLSVFSVQLGSSS